MLRSYKDTKLVRRSYLDFTEVDPEELPVVLYACLDYTYKVFEENYCEMSLAFWLGANAKDVK